MYWLEFYELLMKKRPLASATNTHIIEGATCCLICIKIYYKIYN